MEKLSPLVSLSYLDLSDNPLLSLTNLCHLNNTLNVYLNSVNIACDWKIFFTKMQEVAGKLIFPDAPQQCTVSTFVRNWSQLTLMDLLRQTGLGER